MSEKRVIPEKYKNRRRHSFSELGTYQSCKWSYYLGRYLHCENKDNIYSLLGTVVHDSLEQYQNQEIQKDEVLKIFLKKFNEIIEKGFNFDSDEEKNKVQIDKYKSCVVHYLKNLEPVNTKITQELEADMWTELNGLVFRGFIDRLIKDGNKYIIEDYKTSTLYAKSKRWELGKQLILYSKYLLDKGIDTSKITLRWDFIKYCNITFKIPEEIKITIQNDDMYQELIDAEIIKNKRSKNFKYQTNKLTNVFCLRNEIGKKLKAKLTKILKYEQYDTQEIERIISQVTRTNSIEHIPHNITKKYEFNMNRGLIEIDLDNNIVKRMTNELSAVAQQIEDDYKINETLPKEQQSKLFEREPISQSDSFYCSKLCGVNHKCKYYQAYLDELNSGINDEYKISADDFRDKDVSLDDLLESALDDTLDDLDILDLELNDSVDIDDLDDEFDLEI